MLVLLGTTIWVSFFDSLNPSAIAQQMLLQSMVKNKRHVWFFILGIGLANAAMGLAVYYGVAAWVSKLLAAASAAFPERRAVFIVNRMPKRRQKSPAKIAAPYT